MEGRRRYRGDYHSQEDSKVNRKPSVGDWQQTVPSWEKKFCTSICKVPWKKIVDAKKYMSCHDNVVNWNDSAAKEAFDNAKRRYYAKIHGLPCEIEVPDPDIYIDEIDWDTQTDNHLILDLARKPVDLTVKKCDNIVIFGDTFLRDQGFSSIGWGDGAEELKEKPNSYHVNKEHPKASYVNKEDPNLYNVNEDKPWEQKPGQITGPVEGSAWTNSGYEDKPWEQNPGQNKLPVEGNAWRKSGYQVKPWEQKSGQINGPVDGHAWTKSDYKDKHWEQKPFQYNGPVEGNAWTNSGYNSWGWYDDNGTFMGGYGCGGGWVYSGPSGWGDGWNDTRGWYQYGHNYAQNYVQDDPNAFYGGAWYFSDCHKEDSSNFVPGYNTYMPGHIDYMAGDDNYQPSNNSYVPRHETSRFHDNNYQKNQLRTNVDGAITRGNFVSEQATTDKWTASRGQLTTSCAPFTSQVADKSQGLWTMEKPVS